MNRHNGSKLIIHSRRLITLKLLGADDHCGLMPTTRDGDRARRHRAFQDFGQILPRFAIVNRTHKHLPSCTCLLYNKHVQKKSHQALLKNFTACRYRGRRTRFPLAQSNRPDRRCAPLRSPAVHHRYRIAPRGRFPAHNRGRRASAPG